MTNLILQPCSSEETFIQDFLVIMKHPPPPYKVSILFQISKYRSNTFTPCVSIL